MAGTAHAREPTPSRLVTQAVRRAQQGDRDALGFLFARYADDVCGYVRSIVRDQHEAEDITQQVFAKLIRVIGKYEEREVPFFAWLLRVARNVAVDHLRRQRTIPVEEVRTGEYDGTGHPGAQRLTELQEALATLPPDQREVLVLRHFAGLSPTARYPDPVTSSREPARATNPVVADGVRDPLALADRVLAARRRPMSERLELALSWNAVAAELRAGLIAATRHTNPSR
jgi:RNA polymerase sigma factor (sigma-70 family)